MLVGPSPYSALISMRRLEVYAEQARHPCLLAIRIASVKMSGLHSIYFFVSPVQSKSQENSVEEGEEFFQFLLGGLRAIL